MRRTCVLVGLLLLASPAGAELVGSSGDGADKRSGFSLSFGFQPSGGMVDGTEQGIESARFDGEALSHWALGAFFDPDWFVGIRILGVGGDAPEVGLQLSDDPPPDLKLRDYFVGLTLESWHLAPLSLDATVGLAELSSNWAFFAAPAEPGGDVRELLGRDDGWGFSLGGSFGIARWGAHRIEATSRILWSYHDDGLHVRGWMWGFGYRLF